MVIDDFELNSRIGLKCRKQTEAKVQRCTQSHEICYVCRLFRWLLLGFAWAVYGPELKKHPSIGISTLIAMVDMSSLTEAQLYTTVKSA